jgi:hypothetical protein
MEDIKNTFFTIMQQKWNGKITQDELKETYKGKFTTQQFLTALEAVLLEKNESSAEAIFDAGFDLDLFNNDTVPMLCKYITETWHKQHENIASLLQSFKMPGSEQALANGMLIKCDYWYDDGDAFIRKCAYALKAIGTNEAHEKLKALATDSNEIIKKYALHQLEKK